MKHPRNCKKCGGKMQQGGRPLEKNYDDPYMYQEALNLWEQANAANQEMPKIDLTGFMPPIPTEDDILGPPVDSSDSILPAYRNRIQEGISKGIIEAPKGWNSAQELYDFVNAPADRKRQPGTPKNWKQNLGVGMMALTTLGSEIAGRVERGRQNQYDYLQQTALGQMNPMPVTDYQPNPYSLYAKYGGSLKKYGGLQHHEYFGPPFSNGAEYKFSDAEKYDKTIISRKLVPQLFLRQFINKKRYKEGGEIMAKGGIYIKPENRGKFTDYCNGKVTEECIQRGLNSPSATIRKRANFARNARKWNKEEGGIIDYKKGGLTPNKARQILHDGTAQGHPLTDKQRRYFGAMSKGHTNYRGK